MDENNGRYINSQNIKANLKRLLFGGCAVFAFIAATPAYANNWWLPADVTIQTLTNGEDADSPPGPEIHLGSTITWTYEITNTGKIPLRRVNVYDRAHTGWFLGRYAHVCTLENMAVNESRTCMLEGTAEIGEYRNTGIAFADGVGLLKWSVDSDESHYTGTLGNPAIDLEKATESEDADIAPGPQLTTGDPVTWTFQVTNTGDVALTDVVISDEQVLPSPVAASTVCEIYELAVGETQTCTLVGTVIEGQYKNRATVSANGLGDSVVSDQDDSHYVGQVSEGLKALPAAVPQQGEAPLRVTFTPNASTVNAIVRYEWDFEGDGVYDRSETVGRDQVFTYNTAGNYNATLRVTDNFGEQATGSILISVGNRPPVVSVNLNPSNGQIPLLVNFEATAADSNGIAQFEWDYDGDGVFDDTTATGSTAFTYTNQGSYQARVRVTDTLGASTTLTIPTLEINALPPGSPSVSLTTSSSSGNPPLAVTLTATAIDPEGASIEQFEWDLNGDGIYDQTTTVGSLQTTFTAVGSIYPRVRVTDAEGLEAEDAVEIYVQPQVNLSVSIDTMDPLLGDTVTVNTTLGGETEASVIIEDRNGQLIRTLVPFTSRSAGSYQDVWDGTDDESNVVVEGDYRAILLYRVDGVVQRLDLALTSGGVQSNPPRTGIPSSFSPFAGDPLDITFTLNRASEVTAFMGLFNVNTRLVTFYQRRPLGRGSHTITWNGENSDGKLIDAPGNDRFLFGIFAYTLPNNAVYVRSGVHVSSVTASPSIYTPTQSDENGGRRMSEIEIMLSRAGTARLTINDADSGVDVAEFDYEGLNTGSNTLTWDGRDNDGNFVAPGNYRLGVTGIDSNGFESITVYALQRVYY